MSQVIVKKGERRKPSWEEKIEKGAREERRESCGSRHLRQAWIMFKDGDGIYHHFVKIQSGCLSDFCACFGGL